MIEMKVNRDGSEILTYDEAGIPIFIKDDYLSSYPNHRARCHWHEDIEFIHVVEGQMNYYLNGESISLSKGDSLMINSSQLHYGYSIKKEECLFYCIIFHPSIIASNNILQKKYVEAVTKNHGLGYLLFKNDKEIASILESIYKAKTSQSPSYELEVIGLFHMLWNIIYKIVVTQYDDVSSAINDDLQIQRQMVSYIYQNYSSSLSLNDIASAGKVCRSRCCQIFKKYVGQSPIEFANSYRLERSKELLQKTDLTITEICTSCGFNHPSYFSKQFQTKYGDTPKNYRKSIIPQT